MNEDQLGKTLQVNNNIESPEISLSQNTSNPKTRKFFLMIVAFLTLLILIVGGYLVYKAYFKNETVENYVNKDEKNQLAEDSEELLSNDIITIPINETYKLIVKHSLLEQDHEPFVLKKQTEFSQSWQAVVGPSDIYNFDYASNEKNLSNLIANEEISYPLKRETINGVEYQYIWQANESGTGHGIVYRFTPSIQIKGYKAFKVLYYYNVLDPNPAYSIDNSYVSSELCIFSLAQLDQNISGYLAFGGASASEPDYCEILKNSEIFEMTIE